MPDVQFILGLIIGAVVALGAGRVLSGGASARVKRYVIIALVVITACLLVNYAGCGGMLHAGRGWKLEKFSSPGRHFTDGCILGAALAFVVYMLRDRR